MDCIVNGVAKSWTQLSDFRVYLPVEMGAGVSPHLASKALPHLMIISAQLLFLLLFQEKKYICATNIPAVCVFSRHDTSTS